MTLKSLNGLDSPAHFRLLVEAVEDYAIYILDPSGHISSWNTGAERNKGYQASEILGRHFRCFYLPKDAAEGLPEKALQEAERSGHYAGEGWRVRKDGSRFWASVAINAMRDTDGDLVGYAKVTRDLTERKASEERFRLLVDAVEDYAIFMLDPEGLISTWNTGAERNMGYMPHEILGRNFRCFFLPEDAAAGTPEHALAEARDSGHFASEGWRVRKDGTRFWASAAINGVRNDDGELLGYAKITRDLTERRAIEKRLRASEQALEDERDRLRTMIQSIGDGVIAVDKAGRVVLINPVAQNLTGFSTSEAWRQPLQEILILVDAATATTVDSHAMFCLNNKQSVRLQHGTVLIARDGTRRDVHVSIAPILTGMGEPNGAMLTFQDVSSLRAAQRVIEFSASHDALTQLPNRWEFERKLVSTIEQVRETGYEAALCMIDLDHFKAVNDRAGHQAGDALLRKVSDLLSSQVRRSDLVARLGGDEFAIILFDCSLEEAEVLLAKIRSSIAALEFGWGGRVFRVSASIGIAAINRRSDLQMLIQRADLSCYAAKHGGRDQVCLYAPEMGMPGN